MKKKKFGALIMAVAGLAAVIAGYFILSPKWEGAAEEELYADIRNAAMTTLPISTGDIAVVVTPEPEYAGEGDATEIKKTDAQWYDAYAKKADKQIDFAGLREKNPDIYAWIVVDGTKVSYPIAHSDGKGDPTYLDHDIYKKSSKSGAIYTDGWNAGDFSDPNTLIYGHNMKNGSMFAGLHKYQDAAFFNKNRTIKIYMDDIMLEYEIFAAYKTGDSHVLADNDFTDADVFTKYIESIYKTRDLKANFSEIDLTAQDRIITLCTCIGSRDQDRYFVQGYLKVK